MNDLMNDKETRMRKLSWLLVVIMGLTVVGCEKKSATEQLKDDMNKAAKEIKKDLENL